MELGAAMHPIPVISGEIMEYTTYQQIYQALQTEVYNRCILPSNKFGIGCYYHIEAVVRNAELLAEKFHADKETVMIAAWLHDIASVTDYSLYEEHHIHGAEIASSLLTQMQYDTQKIPLIQACIRNHRGSVPGAKVSAEELCIADADAISHFDSVPSLLYLAYVERGMSISEGIDFVRGKLERSYRKLSPASKDFYFDKYQNVMAILK